jgi:predicted AlkP superfamily pyrophosphatase or phosphodiesterase
VKSSFSSVAILVAALSGASLPASFARGEDGAPRLVLQLTVDGLRADLLTRNIDHLGGGGFRYLLDSGVVFANAHYQHANTETIVGHATLATGAQPAVHGMLGNVWYDAGADALSYNVEDPEHLPLPVRADATTGEQVDPAQRLARTKGRSPRALLAETVADKLLTFNAGRSKVFGISGKDRSAIVMAGHGGKAFWMSTDSGDFVTTSYYYDAYPSWVAAWNAERKAEGLAEEFWKLLDDRTRYAMAHQDDRSYESDLDGYGRVFPHRFGRSDSKLLYTQVLASPYGDALLADFAKALVAGESLGDDSIPDYLSVSFSGVDAVNHFFGPASLETEDMVRQLDRTLADFLSFIDRRVGLEHTLIVLSADHGMPEAPEYVSSLGAPAGRLWPATIVDAAQRLGREAFGLDEVVKFYYRPFLYLRAEHIEAAGLDPETVREGLARLLTRVPGIHVAVTRSSLEQLTDRDLAARIRNNLHRDREGDIYIVQEPYWFNFDPGPVAVMHGSPWKYDTHVPVIFAGSRVATGVVYRPIQPADVAPTLAALLGMSPPASAQGTVLPEVFP